MPFRATCPFCGASFPDVPDARRGQKARCARCSQVFLAVLPDPAVPAAMEQAQRQRVRFLRIAALIIDPEIVKTIPLPVLERNQAVPVGKAGNDLIVAMTDPGDLMKVDTLRRYAPTLKPVLALAPEIDDILTLVKEGKPPTAEVAPADAGGPQVELAGNKVVAAAIGELEKDYDPNMAGDLGEEPKARHAGGPATPARAAVANILERAIKLSCTEVRLMPQDERTMVQGRTEAGLQEITTDQDVPYHQLLARLKDEAGCDPTKRGVEQTGSIPHEQDGKEYEFYLRVLPGRQAEIAQMRILDAAAMRQRRALERRQKVDGLLAELSSEGWPAAGSGIDTNAMRDMVAAGLENKPPAVRLAYAVLLHAKAANVRDLVLEPQKGGLRILSRGGDGDFTPMMTVPACAHKPLLARLQIMASIDLAYTTRSLQGHFYLVAEGGSGCEVRVATLPTDIGQWVVVHFARGLGT